MKALKSVIMYAAETLSLNANKGFFEELEKKERKIVRSHYTSKLEE